MAALTVARAAEARAAMLDWLAGGPATCRQLAGMAGIPLPDAAPLVASLEHDGLVVADRSLTPTRWALRPEGAPPTP